MNTFSSAAATAVRITFQALATSGSVSIPGLQPGDVVLRMIPEGYESGYEMIVSEANQIQQTTSLDWSDVSFTMYLLRGV